MDSPPLTSTKIRIINAVKPIRNNHTTNIQSDGCENLDDSLFFLDLLKTKSKVNTNTKAPTI